METLKVIIKQKDGEPALFHAVSDYLKDRVECFHKGKFREIMLKEFRTFKPVEMTDDIKDFIHEYEVHNDVHLQIVKRVDQL